MPSLYPFAREALFRVPAETAHEMAVTALSTLPYPIRRALQHGSMVDDVRLASRGFGVDFPNPVGLGAGFDKGATAYNGLAALGFGFIEIGTITAHPQAGNPKPRLFRLREDRALLNRMGFNNPGAAVAAHRLARRPAETVLGINIGKSKITSLADAVGDYVRSVELLHTHADYLVVNVSSPNTPGLRELQDAGPLRELLQAVLGSAHCGTKKLTPVLVKLAPDLEDSGLRQAVEIALEVGVDGIVATNTTVERANLITPADRVQALGAGGISGFPLRERAIAMLGRIFQITGGSLPLIGVGGIFTAEDAWQRIRAGASLIQLYTGFVYHGPGIVHDINRGLLRCMERDGFATVSDAVGTGAP